MPEVTPILEAIERGDPEATARLLPLVYEELRRIARAHMRSERGQHTLQATALVHEAYMRLVGSESLAWGGRGRFFATASEAMRRILIDHARRRTSQKRGGGQVQDGLDPGLAIAAGGAESPEQLLDLSDALDRLAAVDPQKAQLVKLIYFAGLTMEEAADALDISRATAHRHWNFARAWLHEEVQGKNPAGA